MKRILTIIFLVLIILYLSINAYKSSNSKNIDQFIFRALYNYPTLNSDYFGNIDNTKNEIVVILPKNVNVTKLIPTFLATGRSVFIRSTRQVSNESMQDFSTTVIYTVQAKNFSTKAYKVRVIQADEKTIERQSQYIKLYRLVMLREPRLSKTNLSDFEKAVILRDHVYQTTPTKSGTIPADINDLFAYYFYGSVHPNYGQLCQGMAITYQSLLEAFNIPSRAVYLFSRTQDPDNHVSVEILVNDKWIISDPTFNVMAKYQNKYVSYKELKTLLNEKKKITWDTNGMAISPNSNRNINTYYISINKLLAYIVISPSKAKVKNNIVSSQAVFLPEDWNKEIMFNGKTLYVPDYYFYSDHPQMRTSMGEHRFAF